MKIGTWILSLVSPLIARALTALGFSVVTITGMEVLLTQVRQAVVTGIGGLPADTLNLFLLAGGGQALGIMFGAFATKLALWQISNATKIVGVGSGK